MSKNIFKSANTPTYAKRATRKTAFKAKVDAFDKWSGIRFQIAAGLFLLGWVFLWGRTFYIQMIRGSELANSANRQHTYSEIVEAQRGTIYDRNGLILAQSIEARSIVANPRAMKKPEETAAALAEIIHGDIEKLTELFLRDRAFIWVSRKVDDATAKKVQEAKLEGITISREYDRIYPQKFLAGQLLGFVGIDNYGLEGVERSFNEHLSGEKTKLVGYRDGNGRRYYLAGQEIPRGKDLHLTLDGQIQFIAEEVISKAVQDTDSKWGGVLIAEAKTGEILASAQYPFFNPNAFSSYSPEIYRNRIASDALEPGSTLKPFPVAAAIEERIISKDTEYFTENGIWQTEQITIGDDGRSYGNLKVNEILRYSSNIGVAKIGLDLGKEKYHDYLTKLGFGALTGIGIAESRGIVRAPREWGNVDLMSAAFGQSVSVTGLQMAQAYLSLANNGISTPLQLVKDKDNLQRVEQRVFSASTAQQIMSMLEEVVESDGTGRNARVTGIKVAGKTGTAQKAAKSGKGYGDGRFASFTGIVPSDAPRYVIIVMLDEPQSNQYGGTIAAPVFQEVATRILAYGGYLPDVVFAQSSSKKNTSSQVETFTSVKLDKSKTLEKLPNFAGVSLRNSMDILISLGIEPSIRGTGLKVLQQYPAANTPLPLVDDNGKTIPVVLWLSEEKEEEEENMQIQAQLTIQ